MGGQRGSVHVCQLWTHMLPHVQVLWEIGSHRARVRASSATLSRHGEPTNVSTAADDDAAAADPDAADAAARDAGDVGAVSIAAWKELQRIGSAADAME